MEKKWEEVYLSEFKLDLVKSHSQILPVKSMTDLHVCTGPQGCSCTSKACLDPTNSFATGGAENVSNLNPCNSGIPY